jgi:hypothetical protein
MAAMLKKKKARKAGSSSKSRSPVKGITPAIRPIPAEAPDRGHLIREREAPEAREVERVEAPDAGYGAAADREADY